MRKPVIPALVAIALACAALGHKGAARPAPAPRPAGEATVRYPAWVPLINVRDFGARGDGKTDDTDAIQKAIQSKNGDRELFFPPGVYLVSQPLVGLNKNGDPSSWLQFYGSGKGVTTIRLKDDCAGFQDAGKPLAVIRFRGLITKESGTAREQPNVAFFNSVYDLTVDVGRGNPGAVGIDWVVCNSGSLRHVNVVSSDPERRGAVGVRMAENDGTAFLRDVTITGFDYGWWRGANAQCMAAEGLRLRGQRKAGIYNKNSVFAARGLESDNAVPTLVQAEAVAQASLLDVRVRGGAEAAIVHENPGCMLYLRNARADGSRALVRVADSAAKDALPGARLSGEWFSHPVPASAGRAGSLNLPIKDAPEFHSNDPARWALVSDFPDDGTGDYSVRLQKAIDSGAETIVMDGKGYKKYRTPVVVRGKVRRIIGFWQSSKSADDATFPVAVSATGMDAAFRDVPKGAMLPPTAWFMRIEGDSREPLIIEQFHHFPGAVLNDSPRPLVFRDMGVPAYANTPRGTGDLFTEGAMGAHFQIRHGQRAWLRSVDAVFGDGPDFLADGATLWILSNRTEGGGAFVDARNGAKVEIIGTSHFIGSRGVGDGVAYLCRDADFSLVNFSELGFVRHGVYGDILRETRGDRETRLDRKGEGVLPRNNLARMMLYRATSASPPASGAASPE